MNSRYDTTYNLSIFIDEELKDNVTKLQALRAIAHSSLAQSIYAIRSHLRIADRHARLEDDINPSVDTRTEQDDAQRIDEAVLRTLGFDAQMTPLERAARYADIYFWAVGRVNQYAKTDFDRAMSINDMLDLMTRSTLPSNSSTIEQLSKLLKIPVEILNKVHDLDAAQELTRFRNDVKDIQREFGSFQYIEDDFELNPLEQCDPVTIYKFAIKVLESYAKGANNALRGALRNRGNSLELIANIKLFQAADEQTRAWIERFAREYSHDLIVASERGQYVQAVDSVPVIKFE